MDLKNSAVNGFELKHQTVSGIKWQAGVSIFQKAISFLATIFLARHLGPSTFGLFAFAMVIIGSFELFKSMGIDAALIRRKNDFDKAANTAFIIIPLLGIFLFFVMFFSSPHLGNMLNNKEIVPVLKVLGVIFVFSCFSRVPSAILEKKMEFKKLSIVDFSGALFFSLFSVIFAFLNFGIWSLVYAYVIKIFVTMSMTLMYAKWKPRFEFDKKIALEMFNFGKFIFLATALGFLRANMDNFLVGKLLGMTMLGYYAIAFNIANFGFDYFGSKITRVTYPAYSNLIDNSDNLRLAFLKTFKYTAIFAIPVGVGTFLLAKEFLLFAYGEKWSDAIGILRILAWSGLFSTLPVSFRAVFLARNRPELNLWLYAIQVFLFLFLITPMAKILSLQGVGIVVSGSSFIAFVVGLTWIKEILRINLRQVFRPLKSTLLATSVMGIGIWLFKHISSNVFLLFSFGIIFYLITISVAEIKLLNEIKQLIFPIRISKKLKVTY